MAVDRASRPYKVVIVAPKETEGTGLDVSELVVSFDGGNNPIDFTGIISFNGTLTLQGFPLGVEIDTNPRRDRIRWARGNRVVIYLANSTGALTKFKTLHILKEPLPPSPQSQPNLAIEVGDKLSLLSFRQPPGDESQVAPGSAKTRREVIQALLTSAKAGLLLGSIAGNFSVPLQKLTNESYIQQAGKIAFAAGRYLWVNRHGDIRISAIDLDAPAEMEFVVGRDDIRYEPTQGSETPAEIVKVTGTRYIVTPTPDTNRTENEAWGLAAVISPNASGKTILSREVITESWSNNVRRVETSRQEPQGIVLPDANINRMSLISSANQVEEYIYESSPEGKLLRIERSIDKPYAVALREYYAALSDEQKIGKPALAMISAEDTDITYDYRKEQTTRIESNTKEPQGAILPSEDWTLANPSFTVPSAAQTQTWDEKYRGEWQAQTLTYGSIARAFPDVIAAMPADASIASKLGVLMTGKQVVTSNSGQAQPPAPDRRKPKFTIEEKAIEAKAEFKSYAGSEFQERERVYDVPYADQDELEAAAKLLGRMLIGRSIGQNLAFALSDDWFDEAPLTAIEVTEFDGSRQKFLLNNVAIAFDARDCHLVCDGIWLGSIESDQTVKPPAMFVIAGSGTLSLGGSGVAYPYPLENPTVSAKGSLQMGGKGAIAVPRFVAAGSLKLMGSNNQFGLRTIAASGTLNLMGGGGEPWADVPRSNLTRYLIASSGVELASEASTRVSQWRDSQGVAGSIGNDEPGDEPLFDSSALNGRPGLRFMRNRAAYLGRPAIDRSLGELVSAQGFTGFVVISPDGNTNSPIAAENAPIVTAGGLWGLYLTSTPAVIAAIDGAGEITVPLPGISRAVLITWWQTPSALFVQINQGEIFSTALSGTTRSSALQSLLTIGSPLSSRALEADLGALALYSQTLPLPDRVQMQVHLMNEFGL